jgi:hypothetical protein
MLMFILTTLPEKTWLVARRFLSRLGISINDKIKLVRTEFIRNKSVYIWKQLAFSASKIPFKAGFYLVSIYNFP